MKNRSLGVALAGLVAQSFFAISLNAAEPAIATEMRDLPIPPLSHAGAGVERLPQVRAGVSTQLNRSISPSREGQSRLSQLQLEPTAQLVQVTSIAPMLLAMPTPEPVDFSKPVAGVGVPRQFAQLAFKVDDENLTLWLAM